MLTPIEIQGITFKTGRGYKKDDVDSFMKALHHDYEVMYKENLELKEKASALSDGVQYYKNLENTLQKALVLAEKTSEETRAAAQMQAEAIEKDAKLKAEKILYEARQELDRIEVKTQELLQNFQLYKAQFKQIISSQMEMVDSSTFDIKKKEFVLSEEDKKNNTAVEPELDKALNVDKSEVKATDEEQVQAEKLAEQIMKEAEPVLEEAVKELEAELDKEIDQESEAEAQEEAAAVKEEKTDDDLALEKELASSIEAMEKEAVAEKETEEATEEDFEDDEDKSDEETDLEIRMLQKLLNEIKKTSEPSDDGEFEFINTASDD